MVLISKYATKRKHSALAWNGESSLLQRRFMRLILLILFATILYVSFGSSSLSARGGNECENLQNNPNWLALYEKLRTSFEEEQYEKALNHSHEMLALCENSPFINYITSEIWKRLGNNELSLSYLKTASMNTSEFFVDAETAKIIWYTRYEAEHPLSTTAAQLERELLQTKNALKEAKKTRRQLEEIQNEHNEAQEAELNRLWKTTWIGAGFGIAGLLALSTGIAFVASTDYQYTISDLDEWNAKIREPVIREAGWTMIGVGIGITTLGSIVTAYGAYHYRQAKHKKNIAFHWALSPQHVSFDLNF